MLSEKPIVKHLGVCDYQETLLAMHEYTEERTDSSEDQIWFVQHPPIITLGRNGNQDNLLMRSDIPVVKSDRGGDITYHAPGQLIMYCLFDLKRRSLGIKKLVSLLESITIDYLALYNLVGHRIERAPGVYVDHRKIASLGLRVRRQCSFHGLAFNINMDLTPFETMHPCGLTNMKVTQLHDLGVEQSCEQVADVMAELIMTRLEHGNY